MTRRFLHVILALGLTLSVLAGTIVTGSASEHNNDGPTEIFLPWVPNGAEIEDPRDFGTTGPYFGTITVQNLEEHQITVHYDVTANGDDGSFTLEGWASRTLTVEDLFQDNDVAGSGVRVWCDDGRIAAVQKQAAPVSPTGEARTGADHEIVAGYTGLTDGEVNEHIVLPIVQTNNNWNTLIRLTNFGTDHAIATITLHEARGDDEPLVFENISVPTGQTTTFDLVGEELPDGWIGSAEIQAGHQLAAVAERVKNETNMLIMNTSKLAADGDRQFAPLVFYEWNHWNTGISIANISNEENVVTIRYFGQDGTHQETRTLIIPPRGMDYVYTPGTVLENDAEPAGGFAGSALITAERPIRGSVDEVKYFGAHPDANHAMSYMLEDRVISQGQSLALPLMQKGDLETAFGDTTGIQLFNPSADQGATAAIWFFDSDGNLAPASPRIEFLAPRQGRTVYAFHIGGLPEDFQGSAIVQHLQGEGEITAVSNNVNYEVQFDGSASFNLVHAGAIAAPGPVALAEALAVEHDSGLNVVGGEHTVTAIVTDEDGDGVQGLLVRFEVSGAHQAVGFGVTDAEGRAEFSFTGAIEGDDTIIVSVVGTELEGELLKVWTDEILPTATDADDVDQTGGTPDFWRIVVRDDQGDQFLPRDTDRILYERPDGETMDLDHEDTAHLYWLKPGQNGQFAEGDHTIYYLYEGTWYALVSTFDEDGELIAVNGDPLPQV